MATSLLAMNAVFGRFFDVLPVEAADPAALRERTGEPYFIFDVQVHYVGTGSIPTMRRPGARGRSRSRDWWGCASGPSG